MDDETREAIGGILELNAINAELLKALEGMVKCTHQWPDGNSDTAWTNARAAIAKARGNT